MPNSSQPNILFDSGAFEGSELAHAFENVLYEPGLISERKMFEPMGVSTTSAMIEVKNGSLNLVAASPRGGIGGIHRSTKPMVVKFEIPHLRTRATLLADTFQNVREFGTDGLTSVERERDVKLKEMRVNLGATIEYHMMRALSGQILDADGSVLVDLLDEFEVTQVVHNLALNVPTTNVRNRIVAAKRLSDEALGAATPTGWICFASADFMDALTAHPSVEAAMAGWSAAAGLRKDVRVDFGFGDVQFVEAKKFAGVTPVEDGAAYLAPLDVSGLYVTRFAPADYIDTANTEGQPYYVRAEPMAFNRGVLIEAQSNPVSVVSNPRAVIKLTAE